MGVYYILSKYETPYLPSLILHCVVFVELQGIADSYHTVLGKGLNWFVHNRMESLRRHVSRLPPSAQQLVLVGLVAFSASPIGILAGILLDLSRRLRGPHPRAAQLNPNYNEDDLDRVSYANIDMLNAIPREPTHAGYVVVGGSGFVGRCVRPVYQI